MTETRFFNRTFLLLEWPIPLEILYGFLKAMVYTYYIIMENIEKNSSQVPKHLLKALEGVTQFSLIQALAGRRSRRFCKAAEIPEGPLGFKSNQKPILLTELEQILVLTSMAGSTGWHNAISYNETVRSKLPSYSAGPSGRTFPSAAGFHTSDLFFTDDNGTYYSSTRDFHPPS